MDIFVINIALFMALALRFEWVIPFAFVEDFFYVSLLSTPFILVSFYLFGLYRSLWRYVGEVELAKIIMASIAGVIFSTLMVGYIGLSYPRSSFIMALFLLILFVGASRLSSRLLRKVLTAHTQTPKDTKRVLIIGAGDAGAMLVKELKNHVSTLYKPVAILDDDYLKWGAKIDSVPVIGGIDKLDDVVNKQNIEEIIIAIPSVQNRRKREILNACGQVNCKVKTVPTIYDIVDNKVTISNLRDVSIEELLGRKEVILDNQAISGYLKEKVVLVTGGGGSIGSELCRQISKFEPKKLLILDNYENSAYELYNELSAKHIKLNKEVIIASVREEDRLREVFSIYAPDVVFHAAAHKHVSLMEENPSEAVKNNVLGTLNTAKCAHEFNAKRFILISTDKAVNPTNVMGATKRLAEMVIQSLNKKSNTEFVAVRFGNVLGSNGSVIPLFKRQIQNGGPVTVTHPEITRFFMTIPEAVRLVIQTGAIAEGGEIFVLNMGKPVKILDLAKHLIRLSGLEPEKDIEIKLTGLKPGEKLYEELLLNSEGIVKTRHQDIFVARPLDFSYKEVLMKIETLKNVIDKKVLLVKMLSNAVPTYKPFQQTHSQPIMKQVTNL